MMLPIGVSRVWVFIPGPQVTEESEGTVLPMSALTTIAVAFAASVKEVVVAAWMAEPEAVAVASKRASA